MFPENLLPKYIFFSFEFDIIFLFNRIVVSFISYFLLKKCLQNEKNSNYVKKTAKNCCIWTQYDNFVFDKLLPGALGENIRILRIPSPSYKHGLKLFDCSYSNWYWFIRETFLAHQQVEFAVTEFAYRSFWRGTDRPESRC